VQEAAVGDDDIDRAQVVDPQPVFACEPADAACRGESTDADATVVAAGDLEPERCEHPGDVDPSGTGPDPKAAIAGRLNVIDGADVDDGPPMFGDLTESSWPAL
jgi:hypothetical protein